MNYGYFGTKELNEALVSRFVVIKMPMISTGNLVKLILDQYPAMRKKMAEKVYHGLRGLIPVCVKSLPMSPSNSTAM